MMINRVPSLDGLRAVSIALVILGHATASMCPDSPICKGIFRGFLQGDLGVTMFFGISGYLITMLLLNELNQTGTISIKNFYIRRAFRIWPAYYTYLGVIILFAAAGYISGPPLTYAAAAFYFWNYNFTGDPGTATWFLGHCWSLCVEEQFYLIWPVTLLSLGVQKARKLAIAIICLSPIIRLLTYFCFTDNMVRGHIGMMLHTRADALMFGTLAAILSTSPTVLSFLEASYKKQLPLFCAIYLFFIKPFVEIRGYSIAVGFTLDSAASVLILMWAVQNPHTLVGRVLNSKIFCHIGAISYSLYLWQQAFLTTLNPTITGTFPLNVISVFIAAECSYFLIERSFLRLRTKIAPT
ncbi:MAG: acyltransferase [Candidatus Obscuribacterales bacterium]|nr:acyltransferase [Candidatus Obscuribacterales bacterium]